MEITLHRKNGETEQIHPFTLASDLRVNILLHNPLPKQELMMDPRGVYRITVDVKSNIWNDPNAQDDVFKLAATCLLPTGILEAPPSDTKLFLDKEKISDIQMRYARPCKFDIDSDDFKRLWVTPKYTEGSVIRPYLYSHQISGFLFWKDRNYRALWAHDMGLGKTFTAGFVLYKNLFIQKWKRPVVITLASILPKWEMILTDYGIPFVLMEKGMDTADIPEGTVLLGNIEKLKRKRAPVNDGTPEGELAARRFARLNFLERMQILFHVGFFDLVIFDESHKLNKLSNLGTEVLSRVITDKTSVLFMSGTPFGNGFHEVYPQMNLIQPGIFDVTTHAAFKATYCKNVSKDTRFTKLAVDDHYFPLLKKKLDTKADFVKNAPGLKLPPFIESDSPYRLTAEQKKIERSITKEYVFPLPEDPPEWLTTMCPKGIPLSSPPLIRHLQRMLCSGYMKASVFIPGMPEEYLETGYPLFVETMTRKKKVLTDILDGLDKDQQALIWVNYTMTGVKLAKELKKEGYSVALVYGSTPKKKRKELVEKFLKGEIQHMISHPKCLGTGLDFINATTQVAYECPESSIDYDQAKKRSHRISQTKAVNMLRLYGQNSIEKGVMDLLSGKINFVEYIFGINQDKLRPPKENDRFRWKFDGVTDEDEGEESCQSSTENII